MSVVMLVVLVHITWVYQLLFFANCDQPIIQDVPCFILILPLEKQCSYLQPLFFSLYSKGKVCDKHSANSLSHLRLAIKAQHSLLAD